LPPKVAPIQVVIVPIYKTDEERATVGAKCKEVEAALKPVARVHVDARDNYTPGFKFNHWEQKGVPVRIAIGPKDVAGGVVEVARRDTFEKMRGVSQLGLKDEIESLLDKIQKNIYERALKFRQDNTVKAATYDELKKALEGKNVFIETFWAGSSEDEGKIKDETKATIRCIPFDASPAEGKCVYTGQPTTKRAIFARSY
jgi:prolyl-tRNA synthetase